MALSNNKVVIAGGTSGIGLATAHLFQATGASVTVTGRNFQKLAAARQMGLETAQVDSSHPVDLATFFQAQGPFDHLILAVGSNKGLGDFSDLSLDDLRAGFEEKYWSHLKTLKAALPFIRKQGSITLVTAIGGSAKLAGTSGIGAVNGALEIMVPILAKEFKPLRINAVSPGAVDTSWWDFLGEEAKEQTFAGLAAKLAVGRVGQPNDIAQAILFLSQNEYITGQVIAVEGGML